MSADIEAIASVLREQLPAGLVLAEPGEDVLGLGTLVLLRHPEQLAELRANRSEHALDRPFEELLRYP
jgi:hypothetical protein